MAPLLIVAPVFVVACVFAWSASVITADNSWVDRLWSLLPPVYLWIFAGAAGMQDARLNVMAVLVTMWGARLTFNFARKGGYSGGEDYRWPVLRSRMKAWQFGLFNLFFIVVYQNILLVLITLPALTAFDHRGESFGVLDAALSSLFFVCLVGEAVADQQQWDFHTWKKKEVASGLAPNPRFLQSGLFRLSRHPNFFFEQAQWWILFFLGATAAGSIAQWTVIGALLLTVLFVGSTVFTESLTLAKYPEYAEYQRVTSPSIPWIPHRQPSETAA